MLRIRRKIQTKRSTLPILVTALACTTILGGCGEIQTSQEQTSVAAEVREEFKATSETFDNRLAQLSKQLSEQSSEQLPEQTWQENVTLLKALILFSSGKYTRYEYEYNDYGDAIRIDKYDIDNNLCERDEMTYDGMGRMTSRHLQGFGDDKKDCFMTEVYDHNGNLTVETYQDYVTGGYLIYLHEYDDLGNRTTKTTIMKEDEDSPEYTYQYIEYDVQENELKNIRYNSDETPECATEKEFDDQGKIVRERITSDDSDVETLYSYDDLGNVTLISRALKGTDMVQTESYEYDNAGNKIKYENIDSGELIRREEFQYNSMGKQTFESVEQKNVVGSFYGHVTERKYDDLGNLIMSKTREFGGSIDQTSETDYDNLERKIREMEYDAEGNIQKKTEYEYDVQGNITKETVYGAGNHVESIKEYEYNAQGNVTKETVYGVGNHVESIKEYEYNDLGNELRFVQYGADGNIQELRTHDYDTNGYWMVMEWNEYDENGNAVFHRFQHTELMDKTVTKFERPESIIDAEFYPIVINTYHKFNETLD